MARKAMLRVAIVAMALTGWLHTGARGAEAAAPDSKGAGVRKPEVFQFGEDFSKIFDDVREHCAVGVIERVNQPIALPTVKQRQTQIDCLGFVYGGKLRKVHFKFADDVLDLVVIETSEEDQDSLKNKLIEEYGKPSKSTKSETVFLDDGVALRIDPHSVIFFSDRLKGSYGKF